MLAALPDFQPSRIAFKLSKSAEKHIKGGHPWVFESAISKQNKEGQAGDLAIIYDRKTNKLLALGLYDPFSPIRIKILALKKSIALDTNWFLDKIEAALQLRTPLFATDTNSYRLIYGENDGLPSLVVDVYAGVLVLKLYSLMWLPYLQFILAALESRIQPTAIVLRLSRNVQRLPQALYDLHDGQVLYGELPQAEVIFKEHGLRFIANVLKGHKTGYFLDHRHNRKTISTLAKGKTILDVFAYAGGFSVHALAGGAKTVTSLDISKQALELARRNVQLNTSAAKHETLAADAFKALQDFIQRKRTFDLVVIDPPALAKSAAEKDTAIRSYKQLVKYGVQVTAKRGIFLMASCSSRIEAVEFYDLVLAELQKAKRPFKELMRTQHDIDHPISFKEGAYLKSLYVQFLG